MQLGRDHACQPDVCLPFRLMAEPVQILSVGLQRRYAARFRA